jgi:hypothetical protein
MSVNLLETVQKNLGYPALKKIDPNTHDVVKDLKAAPEDKFSQAAIPAVLTGMYRYVQSDEGAAEILRGDYSSNWVARIFENHSSEAIEKITGYATESNQNPVTEMAAIANEAIKVVKENLAENASVKDVKIFFSNQRNTILLYLPPALNMGELLNDDTLDDDTNKMEGPVSSLMKSIGNAFTNPVTSEEIKH